METARRRSNRRQVAAGPRRTRTNHVTVCVLANHPFLLGQLGEDLSKSGLSTETFCLSNLITEDVSRLPIPAADVYVLDAHDVFAVVLAGALLNRFPKSRMIVVAEKFTDEVAFPFLELGSKGLLTYPEARERLAEAVRTVGQGEFWVPRPLLSRFMDSIVRRTRRHLVTANRYRLSRREREVLQGLLEHLSNKEIASRLSISERTVKFHVSNLLAKFNVRRRADLVALQFREQST